MFGRLSPRISIWTDVFLSRYLKIPNHVLCFARTWELWGRVFGLLSAAGRVHGDDRIDFLVLEPDAETYYREGYGIYPAISLPVDSSEDDYWNSVSYEPDGDPTGALVFSARVFAVSGPSGKWGCWGELGVEVVAVQGIPDIFRTENGAMSLEISCERERH